MGKNEYQSREDCSIDIHKLEEILEPTANCCIYRVPQFLRKINEEAYSPRLISIGPLHYQSRDDLMGMERQKRSYLTKFGQRQEVGIWKLEAFKTYVKSEEANIRTHYAVSSVLRSSEYVEMILQDSIFIIELFLRNDDGTKDFLLEKSQLKTYITLDLLLLENQLPYFVLDHIYSAAFPSREGTSSFFSICLNFFSTLYMCNWSLPEGTEIKHFTDLLRRSVLLEKMSNSATAAIHSNNGEILPSVTEESKDIFDLPTATKLNESGLKFKSVKEKHLLEIKLRHKRNRWLPWLEETEVEIPCIEVYDDIESLFRNVMVLELFHYPTETYVCHYADLMNYLIDTAKDVDLLAEKGIVANCMGDYEKIAQMCNNLTSCITPSPSNCYYGIAEEMKTHYNNRWNHLKATLKSVYFANLWTGTATVAAIFLLILTVIQTVCSIMQV